jgi:hypothetical protein
MRTSPHRGLAALGALLLTLAAPALADAQRGSGSSKGAGAGKKAGKKAKPKPPTWTEFGQRRGIASGKTKLGSAAAGEDGDGGDAAGSASIGSASKGGRSGVRASRTKGSKGKGSEVGSSLFADLEPALGDGLDELGEDELYDYLGEGDEVDDPMRGFALGLGSQSVPWVDPSGGRYRISGSGKGGAATSGGATSGKPSGSGGAKVAVGSGGSRVAKPPTVRKPTRSFPQWISPLGKLPRLSSKAPGLLFVLTDTSSSMKEPFAGMQGIRKADAVADVVNGVLLDFISQNNSGGVIKPRLDVNLTGYGGGGGIRVTPDQVKLMFEGPLAGKETVSIADLADNPADEIEIDDGEGGSYPQPIWVQPKAEGRTPMANAFGRMRKTVGGWKGRNAGERLILGIHVTDGDSTDGDPIPQLRALAQEVEAAGGKLLMTNIHISETGSPDTSVVFPDEADASQLDALGQRLFEMSSPVPANLAEKLGTKPGARMMAYNASVDDLARVFEAGSSVALQ